MNNIINQKQQYHHNNNNKWQFTTFRSQQQQQQQHEQQQPSFILKPINEQNLSDLEQIVSATLAVQYKNPRIFQQMLRLGKRLSCVVYNQHNGQAIGAMGCRVEVIKNINNNNHVNNNINNNNTDDDDNQKNKNNNSAPLVRSAIDDAISHMKMNTLYITNSSNHSNHNNSNSDYTLINDTTMIEQSDKKHEEQIVHVKIYLMTLSVLAPYRNLGIGAMMIQYLLSGVTRVENANPNRIIKVNGIYLHVQEGNEGALRFYSRYGFKEERFIEKYYRSVLPSGAHVLHIEFPSSSSEVSSC